MSHITLVGDSIFDNQSYVSGPDVVAQLRAALPAGWDATLRAVDGDVTRDVAGQLGGVPAETTHLVVSVGGNDALGHLPMLTQPASSVSEALLVFADVRDAFRRDYRAMLDALLGAGLPAAVCTIYEPRFPDPVVQRVGVTALAFFNDVIVAEATALGLPVVDLRRICTEAADYANDIEPAEPGGEKIAATIARWALSGVVGGPSTVLPEPGALP